MISKNENIDMQFELLGREAFNCGKQEDPFGYANANLYDKNFVPEPNLRAKRALSTFILKFIMDNKDTESVVDELKKLDDKVWSLKTQQEAITVITKLVEIVNSIKVII